MCRRIVQEEHRMAENRLEAEETIFDGVAANDAKNVSSGCASIAEPVCADCPGIRHSLVVVVQWYQLVENRMRRTSADLPPPTSVYV